MAEYLMDYIYGELDNRTANAVCWKRYYDLPKADVHNYMRYAILEDHGTDSVYQCRKLDGEYVWIKMTQEDLLKAINNLNKSLIILQEDVNVIKKQGKGDKGDTGAQGPQGIPGEPRDLCVDGTSVVDPITHIANLTTDNFVEAGDNVSIDGKKISAIDTTYTAVEPLHISDDNVISIDSEAFECKIDKDWEVAYNVGGWFAGEKIEKGKSLEYILNILLTNPKPKPKDNFFRWCEANLNPAIGPTIIPSTAIKPMLDSDWRQGFIRFDLSPNREFECFAYPTKVTMDNGDVIEIGDPENNHRPTKIWDNDDSDHNMVSEYGYKLINHDGKEYVVCWYPELLKANNDITTVFWR